MALPQKRVLKTWLHPEVLPCAHRLPGESYGASNSKIFHLHHFRQAIALPKYRQDGSGTD